jgi:hypothetical protein
LKFKSKPYRASPVPKDFKMVRIRILLSSLSASESDHPHREPDGLGRGFLSLAKLAPCYSELDPKSKADQIIINVSYKEDFSKL